MARIDADAHVDETHETWEYLEEQEQYFRPFIPDEGTPAQRWQVEDLVFRKIFRNYRQSGTSAATSGLLDVPARLAHLDELRIDIQVLFPTIFLRSTFVGHEAVERGLTRSYNRWIAERTEQSNGRLRWVAVAPMFSIDAAVRELEWAKAHGACGVFKKGVECSGRLVSDPYFFPLYEAASALDLPICIHTGSEGLAENQTPSALDAVRAFTPLVNSEVFERFPAIRVGFIEAGAAWVPFLLSQRAARTRTRHMQGEDLDFGVEVDLDLFRRLQIYVTCQSQEDLPYLLRYGLEDNLMVGTDYTHSDEAAELKALDRIEEQGRAGHITAVVARKILDDNPRRFFGL